MKNIIYSPLASLVLLVLSGSFMLTFITVKLNVIGENIEILGLIHSSFYGGMLVGALKSELIINRVGHIRAFAFASGIFTIAILLQALYPTPYLWIFFRFFSGFATASSYVIIESWLLSQSTKSNKGKILSIYMISLYSAQTLGQFILDIVDIDSMEPFLLAGLLSSLAIIPASLTYVQAPDINPLPKLAITKYFTAAPLGIFGCVSSGLILSAIYSFLPKYAMDIDFDVPIMLGSTIAGGFCLQWPIGKLSDAFDRVHILLILSILILVTCLAFPFIGVCNPVMHYVIIFFLGGLCFTIYPLSIAYVCDCLENTNIINVTGVLLFSYGTGAVMGPPIVATFIDYFSTAALFYYIACVCFLLCLLIIYYNKSESTPLDQQVKFIAMPRISNLLHKLYPKAKTPKKDTLDK